MIGFKDLKSIIVRSSRTTDDKNKSSDINNKFNFVINVDRLEKALSSKSDLHVVAFNKNIVSRVPDISELQLISEYVCCHNAFGIDLFAYIFKSSLIAFDQGEVFFCFASKT